MCVLFIVIYVFFIGETIAADNFKYEVTTSLKTNGSLKSAQDLSLNIVRGKGTPQCKLSYKIFKESYGYDTLLDIYTYQKLLQLKNVIDGINHYVTVVGKCIFDSNFPFVLPDTKDNLDYCLINENVTKVMNGYKGLLKAIRFTPQHIIIIVSFRS